MARYAVFGFAFIHGSPSSHDWTVTLPLYILTLLAALLLVYVWRKTRAKPAGGAFPVEPVVNSGVEQA